MDFDIVDKTGKRLASILLFSNVKNTSELRQMAVEGKISACFVRAALIVDLFQVQCAVKKALIKRENGTTKTRTILSEILYELSPVKNITESMKQIGIHDSDSAVIVVLVDDHDNQHLEMLLKCVQGEQEPLSRIADFADPQALRKLFKVTDKKLSFGSLLDAVVTRMAIKDYV